MSLSWRGERDKRWGEERLAWEREVCKSLLLVDDYSWGGCQLAEGFGTFLLILGMLFSSLVYLKKLVSRSRVRKDNCAFVQF